ncbi:phage tail tip lysozyme [Phyllobacterium endophyticum]|uniref:phage tail tip lysozyme n=1 Tax=Phyllobacterium endophyticum TaxID=1149773 RepID=UPI0011C90184|nr:phage tail tip lysozyme [Phyllobacterium endophyticum]TXR49886.1 hypothetical protein FVA77_07690 [Phyllobacterium endophyticum]
MAQISPRAKEAFDFYVEKGMTPTAAAGFVGNLMGESDMNPEALRKDDAGPGLHSEGIGQWNRERLAGLKRLAASRGTSHKDFRTQLEWGWEELQSSERAQYDRMMNAKDIDEATDGGIMYERPVGSNKGPRNGHNWSGRNANARALLGMAPGMAPVTPSATVAATEAYNPFDGQNVNQSAFTPSQTPEIDRGGDKPADWTWGGLGMAAVREAPTYAALHGYDPEEMPDMDWARKRTEQDFLNMEGFKDLPDEQKSFVMQNSFSPANAMKWIAQSKQDLEDEKTFASAGLLGTGASIAANVFDPMTVAVSIGTGGVGPLARAGVLTSRLAKGVETGAVIAGETALVSAPKLSLKSNYSANDLLFDTASAMVIGTAAGSIFAHARGVDDALETDAGKMFEDVARQAQGWSSGKSGSMGAAAADGSPRVRGYVDADGNEIALPSQIDKLEQPGHWTDKIRLDAHSNLIDTDIADVVDIGNKLMPDMAGTGGVTMKGKEDAWNFKKRSVEAIGAAYNRAVTPAFHEWVAAKTGSKFPTLSAVWQTELRKEFNELVTQAVVRPDGVTDEAIKKAAAATVEHNNASLKLAAEAGVPSAKGLIASDTYMHATPDREAIRRALDVHGEDAVEDGIMQAMQDGMPDAGRTYASKIATREARKEAAYAVKDAKPEVKAKAQEQLEADLKDIHNDTTGKLVGIGKEHYSATDHVDMLYKDHVANAKAERDELRLKAKELRKQVQGKLDSRAQRILRDAEDMEREANEVVKGTKAAAERARKEVNKALRERANQMKAEAKTKVDDARADVKNSRKTVQKNYDEQKNAVYAFDDVAKQVAKKQAEDFTADELNKVWLKVWQEESDNAFKQAQEFFMKRMARKYLRTMRDVSEDRYGDLARGLSGEDREAFKKALIDSGKATEDEAEAITQMIKGSAKSGANPLKSRTPLSMDKDFMLRGSKKDLIEGTQTPFSVRSLFNQDSQEVSAIYREAMATAAALKKAGFDSEGALRQHIIEVTDAQKLRDAGEYVTAKQEAKLLKARDTLNMYADRLLGKPLVKDMTVIKHRGMLASKIVRDLAYTTFMQLNGIAQLGDAPKIVLRSGMSAAWKQFRMADLWKTWRTGDNALDGPNSVMRAIEMTTGIGSRTGTTQVVERFKGLDEYQERSWFSKHLGLESIANKTGAMARATSLTGFASPTNDFLSKLSSRASLQAFVDHATGYKKISGKLVKDMGLDDEIVGVINQLKDNGYIKLGKNNVVDEIYLDKMKADDWMPEFDKLMGVVNREARTQIMETAPSSLPTWMQGPLGQIFMQLKSYAFGSFTSNTVRNMKLGWSTAVPSLMVTSMWSGLVYYAQSQIKAAGRPDREEYLDKALSYEKWAEAALARSSDVSILPGFYDTVIGQGVGTAIGQDLRLFSDTRTSGLSQDFISGIPAVSMGNALWDATAGSLTDLVRSDRTLTEGEAKRRLQTILPFTKMFGLNAGINAGIPALGLPEKEKRDQTFTPDR